LSTLTCVDSEHGYESNNAVDTDGYMAVIPAFQSCFFADGRDYDDNGYHKLEFHTTKFMGTADGAAVLTYGEAVFQTTSGATGFYLGCEDVKITINGTSVGDNDVPFQVGEKVTQASSGAIGYVTYVSQADDGSGWIAVCPISRNASTGAVVDFDTGADTITGATSGSTITNVSAVSAIGVGPSHFIYRTSTTEFATDENVKSTVTPANYITQLAAAGAVQHLYPDASATGGSFTITYDGQTTAAIDHDATTAEIKTALELLSSVEVDDIAVSGTTFDSGDADNPLILTFATDLGSVNAVTVTESLATTTSVTVKSKVTGHLTVTAPPHWRHWKPVATYTGTTNPGTMPDGGSNIGCLCFGRIFLNSMKNPHQWFCSRVFDPCDWDSTQTDIQAATSSQNAKAGEVGAPITAMIPYKDHYLIFGCTNEVWILRSDPIQGGVNTCVSKTTGIFSPTSWCWDDKNNLYFVGTDGIYRLSTDAIINAQPPENITKERVPKLVSSMALNRRTDRVAMGYDKDRYGIEVSVTQKDGAWGTVFWLDLRTGGLFPDSFPTDQSPASMFYFDSYKGSERGLLLGGYDGYIRKFDEDETNDEGSNAIDSFVTIGPFVSTREPRMKVETTETSLVMGEDTDGITVDIHSGDSGDNVVTNVIAGSTPLVTKTLSGDGVQNSVKDRVSGKAIAIKLKNSTASESWSIEDINVEIKESGRRKV